jgi:hypothetical protein
VNRIIGANKSKLYALICAKIKGEFKMTTETNVTKDTKAISLRSGRLVGGALLILFGILILGAKAFDLDMMLVAFPGLAMLLLGIVTRNSGWLIPAGILNGISLAILATEQFNLSAQIDIPIIFLLCFAVGWFSIPLFSMIFTRDRHLWALIPGGVMAVIGGTMAGGIENLEILSWFNYLVPAALILVGLGLVFNRKK